MGKHAKSLFQEAAVTIPASRKSERKSTGT